MVPQTRRRFLSVGAAATVATITGCLGSSGSTDDTQRVLRLSVSRRDGSLRDRYVDELSETRPEWSEDAFEATLDGVAYTTQQRKPFFSTPDDPVYAERDGTYYLLGSVVVGEASETRPVLRLRDPDTDAEATADEDGSAVGVDVDQLPDGDRRAVRIAHMATRARGNEGGVPWGLVERGGYVYRRDDAVEASRLLADEGPGHVVYRDTRYAVETSRERFHEPIYRATIDPVATDSAEMEAVLRAKFTDARIGRRTISTDARDILREAQGSEYTESYPYSSGYRELLTALRERAFLDGNVSKDATTDDLGRGVFMYDDAYFEYRLRFESGSA